MLPLGRLHGKHQVQRGIWVPTQHLVWYREKPRKILIELAGRRTFRMAAINHLNPKKSPGYDLFTGNILKELPIIGIKYLTQLFNAILLINYFLTQWKVAQTILILK
jgi:hypothetical protein